MSFQVLTGAALVAAAVPVAWWSVANGRSGSSAAATLTRGLAPRDLRAATLDLSARERAVGPAVQALAARARRLTPVGMVDTLERRLVSSGLQGRMTIEQVLAAKLGLLLAAVVLGALYVLDRPSPMTFAISTVAAALGWFAPDVILHGKADDRRKQVQLELPDTMDQITISVEAGLGFEAAMGRIASSGNTLLGQELARTLQDIRLGMPRAEALDELATRCDLADLRHFVTAIRQAERFGLPIAQVLRVQSNEMRDKRRQRAEEHAMKIPVKVLFPLVLCILPTLFIVIIGPGAIRIAESFAG